MTGNLSRNSGPWGADAAREADKKVKEDERSDAAVKNE